MSSVGDNIKSIVGGWTFGGEVPSNFDAHVSKSVPLYYEGHNLICDFSDYFINNNSIVYDIGCSTGALLNKLDGHHSSKKNIQFIGVDIEEDMINFARNKSSENIQYINDDYINITVEKSDLIIAYYTIQFVNQSFRQVLIDKIYNSLNWGGAFIMFEKVRAADARFQDIMVGVYNDYKFKAGYSSDDILNKSRSLRGILEPFSTQGNIDMLKRAGFKDINTIQKYICFEGFLAIK